jgi:hypothetical protein
MSSPETPTPVATTRWTPGGTSYSPVYGVEAYLPPETLLDPHGSRLLTSPYRNGYNTRTRTPSSNADGNPGSGPSPTASTKPRRAPQLSPD